MSETGSTACSNFVIPAQAGNHLYRLDDGFPLRGNDGKEGGRYSLLTTPYSLLPTPYSLLAQVADRPDEGLTHLRF
jgi:hypothetical protein